MYPTIHDRDWLFVRRTPSRVRPGDIAVISRDSGSVVHRVISSRPWREMGDACTAAQRFEESQIDGIVMAIVRPGQTVKLTGPGAWGAAQVRRVRNIARHVIHGRNTAPPVSRDLAAAAR